MNFWDHVQINSPRACWPWTRGLDQDGYGQCRHNGAGARAHRVAFALTNGGTLPAVVCHSCDNPRCCNPGHLFAGTPQSNIRDRDSKGRQARGEKHGAAKLTDRSVRKIRSLRLTDSECAALFGVTLQNIRAVRARKTWKHIAHRNRRPVEK